MSVEGVGAGRVRREPLKKHEVDLCILRRKKGPHRAPLGAAGRVQLFDTLGYARKEKPTEPEVSFASTMSALPARASECKPSLPERNANLWRRGRGPEI